MEEAVRTRASTVSVGVLGPLVVSRDGEVVAVGGPQERTVLAHLVARANVVAPVAALIESVWGDHPPPSAERSLQAHVARLRRALEPDRSPTVGSSLLTKEGAGYRLCVETDQVDALRFEELARRGAQLLGEGDRTASSVLRDALDLWRGDAFGEFAGVEVCEAEARRLEEIRVVAIEDRVDADLASGTTSQLVPELESLVLGHEFRERLWAQLMLALYRSGRQRDALSAYRRARGVLVEQLGIEPGRDLRDLEAAILAQDPSLDLPVATPQPFGLPAPLESVGPAFVGRDAELGWLRSAWLDAADGRGGFVSILGPEGIGKTRLVAELGREAQRAGGAVLYGRCGDGGSGVRALLGQAFPDAAPSLDGLDGEPAGELGREVMQLLAAQFSGRPVLLAVDDAHLADSDTVQLLADLAGWSSAGPLLVVATFRTEGDAKYPSLPERTEVGAHVVLRGLDRASMQRVCEMYAADTWWPDDMDRLHELTGGVPLRVHELASEWARERAIHDVGAAADRSEAAQARLAGLRAEIAQSVEGIQHVLEQHRANVAPRNAPRGEVANDGDVLRRCPYKGLVAFETSDAADFFGRERLVAELVARLAGTRLLAVVGPSGCGKSSVVRAGLLPALAAGVLPAAGGWHAVVETPAAWRRERGKQQEVSSARGRRLLVCDQFEELFLSGFERADQEEYVDRVVSTARDPDQRVVVIVRSDHLDRCIEFDDLARIIAGNDVLVGPMTDVELRRAIERPVQRSGSTFEPGVVDVMIADVAGRPGALPLLSTALVETWERSSGGELTLAAYADAGGVNGALTMLAEEAFSALDPAGQLAIRRLLMSLCDTADQDVSAVRRGVSIEEIDVDTADRSALAEFVRCRLLVIDRGAVQVAHEALLREWPRLRAWMDEDRQGERLRRRLREAASTWHNGEDASELYRGPRLDAALDWVAVHSSDLTAVERAFLGASEEEAVRELDDARRRAAQKARDNRRLRWAVVALAGLLIVAAVSGVLFVRQRDRAERTARDARVRELAGEAVAAIDEDPDLAMLLGLEAIEISERAGQPPLPEAVSALHAATQSSRLVFHRPEAYKQVDVTSDGTRIATASASDPSAAVVWDAESGDELMTLAGPSPDAVLEDVAFSPDGALVGASYSNDADGVAPAVLLWDATTGQEVVRVEGVDDVYTLAFSADGGRVVTVSEAVDHSRVTTWDVDTGSKLMGFDIEGFAGTAVFLPDDTSIAVTEIDGEQVGIYSTDDGTLLRTIPTPGFRPQSIALHGDNGLLALGSQPSGEVRIVDLDTGLLVRRIPAIDGGVVDWSPDGARLAIGGVNQSLIRIVGVSEVDETLMLSGHQSGSWDVAFIDDDRLASVGQTAELRVWDVSAVGPLLLHAIAPSSGSPLVADLSPDGSELIVTTVGQTIERLDAETGERLAALVDQLVDRVPYEAPVSADGRYVASISVADGSSAVLDASSLASVTALPACTRATGLSSDAAVLVLDGQTLCGVDAYEASPDAELRSRIIERVSGREILDLGERWIVGASFNPAGLFAADRFVAVNVGYGTVEIYDLAEGRLIGRFTPDDYLIGFVFDPTGRWLAASTAAGRVLVFDLAAVVEGTAIEEAVVLDLVAHDGSVTGMDISADGTLATIGLGEEARLWDLSTGELVIELRAVSPAGLRTLAFSPDGSYLLYIDGPVLRRYYFDTDQLTHLARNLLTRELSDQECETYVIDCD